MVGFKRQKKNQATTIKSKSVAKRDQKLSQQTLSYPTLELLPYKRITNDSNEFIELVDPEYGYLQLLELPSKDTHSLGVEEVEQTIANWHLWLSRFLDDFTIYTTKLPTDTTKQVQYQASCLAQVRQQMKQTTNPRRYQQLRDRERLLEACMEVERQIREQIYNVEFILMLFAKTPRDLLEVERKAQQFGNGDFVPRRISREKKEQILNQYNNMNDKL